MAESEWERECVGVIVKVKRRKESEWMWAAVGEGKRLHVWSECRRCGRVQKKKIVPKT